MWWAKASAPGVYTKIDESELVGKIVPAAEFRILYLPPFSVDIKAGDELILLAQAGIDDGAYLQSDSSSQYEIDTQIELYHITKAG